MDRFILKNSATEKGVCVFTDTANGIVIRFDKHRYNGTQKITLLEDFNGDEKALAKALREMGEWIMDKYPYIAAEDNRTCSPEEIRRERIALLCQQKRLGCLDPDGEAELDSLTAGGMILGTVKEAMRRQGMKAAQLSELTGVDRASLSLFLSGKRNLSQPKIEAIFSVLGITLKIEP